ncbi:MAG: radical SAM protein [Candidatus Thorarchaeota archaeon]|nr:MAG: radical SAM protein [Candidatus Thorarchaeota archaeon]
MVKNVRLSLGTAIQIGLIEGEPDPFFTTAFLMTYLKGRCSANCAFCPQAHDSTSTSDRLSRISWPKFELRLVLPRIADADGFRRLCVQSLNYPEAVDDVESVIIQIRRVSNLPLSVCIHPITSDEMHRLRQAGATSIGIAIDACTPRLFDFVKGADRGSAYRWEAHLRSLQSALKLFGKGNVTTHLIIGLGETEREAAEFLLEMKGRAISVGLFAFTSIRGTSMEGVKPPQLASYRRLQVLRYLLATDEICRDQVRMSESGQIQLASSPNDLRKLLSSGEAFRTSGCVGCNRPYYNERPRGPIYNYARPLTEHEAIEAIGITGLMT